MQNKLKNNNTENTQINSTKTPSKIENKKYTASIHLSLLKEKKTHNQPLNLRYIDNLKLLTKGYNSIISQNYSFQKIE